MPNKTPMSRFDIHDDLTAPEASLPILKGLQSSAGQLPNFLGVLAGSAAALRGYVRFRGELHAVENAINVSACLRRAAAWFHEQGCGPVEAVLSDNAKCYTGHAFQATLGELGARHIRCPPYTPRWNGKLERFWHTLDCEWAHSRVWPNSTQRDRALASFIRYYNRRRPHSAAGGRAPITRVQQVRKHDI
jgi:transposase InsO family protein